LTKKLQHDLQLHIFLTSRHWNRTIWSFAYSSGF